MTGQRALDETGGLLAQDERLSKARCAIIGGGLAGASLTQLLKAHGVGQVTLIDKGRALGGRESYSPSYISLFTLGLRIPLVNSSMRNSRS